MPQLNIRLNGSDVQSLSQYASDFGLDRTGLANLLLRRELRLAKLGKLDRSLVKHRDPNRPRNEKITAYLPTSCLAEFSRRAAEFGLSRSAAGALILLRELEEKWLEHATAK